jgi:predicted RND superfamily exporter protein/lauroyl/myristoyl acyltransferase
MNPSVPAPGPSGYPALKHPGRWLWLLLLVPVVIGLTHLRFDVEIFDLLPPDLPPVQGLKLYQEHFSNARELIITVQAKSADAAEAAARSMADDLRRASNLVSTVTWQPPWLEHPEQAAELVAYLWFNQPPELLQELTNRLAPDKLVSTLSATREELATSMSPQEIGRLSYDPFGLTRLPEQIGGAAPAFGQGQELFSSAQGTFRVLFVQAREELRTYRDCAQWLSSIKAITSREVSQGAPPGEVNLNYTGRPAFVAEISTGMEHDMTKSILGTAAIIAVLFWLAHRRIKPMLWLLTLLALILGSTLALGGLIFVTINVVSMGFAGILLGLAVDYAVVHYQEALAHPNLSIPQIRHAIAPSIFWAAVTTISAFLVLNFGGLPGLAQLGTLVGLGVALAALIMIFEFLPPLFPERRQPAEELPHRFRATADEVAAGLWPAVEGGVSPPGKSQPIPETRTILHNSAQHPPGTMPGSTAGQRPAATSSAVAPNLRGPFSPRPGRLRFAITFAMVLCTAAVLLSGLPRIDPTATALRPRNSPAYSAVEQIQVHLGQKREPLWLVIAGKTVSEVADELDQAQTVLSRATSNGLVAGFNLPIALWPRPEFQQANRPVAKYLAAQGPRLREAALTNGFADQSLVLTEGILNTWRVAADSQNVFWPTNPMSQCIFDKIAARTPTNFFTMGMVTPNPKSSPAELITDLQKIQAQLPPKGTWLSGWELLGSSIFGRVKANLWKVLVPMVCLVLFSLYLAFGQPREILLSLGVLALSGLCLLSVMRVAGWSWNLLNLMAIPLVLGTGVDYSIFMQLALRRHKGDLNAAYLSVGRALLLCGGTAIAGFGSLGLSSNAGMASLGQVCAVGVGSNMLIAIFLLPVWWKHLRGGKSNLVQRESKPGERAMPSTPSSLYRSGFWRLGLTFVRVFPAGITARLGHAFGTLYWLLARHRRAVVMQNLAPALGPDTAGLKRTAKNLFHQFARKVTDLWRFEAGLDIAGSFSKATGWEHFQEAHAQKRGVLLLTPHLGNWEFGGPMLTRRGISLQVLTLAEPGKDFTQLRQASRARWQIETLVVGADPLAFVEVIKRLESGATVALLVDRPPPASSVSVELFGRPFQASIAAAELARASGCVLLPVYIPWEEGGYAAHMLPAIPYERAGLRDRAARQQLTQQIVRVFEPIILRHIDQWYHFVPIWPNHE